MISFSLHDSECRNGSKHDWRLLGGDKLGSDLVWFFEICIGCRYRYCGTADNVFWSSMEGKPGNAMEHFAPENDAQDSVNER